MARYKSVLFTLLRDSGLYSAYLDKAHSETACSALYFFVQLNFRYLLFLATHSGVGKECMRQFTSCLYV